MAWDVTWDMCEIRIRHAWDVIWDVIWDMIWILLMVINWKKSTQCTKDDE